jgi:hypothetical protein
MNFLNIFTTSILSFLLKSTVEKYLFIPQDKNSFIHQQFIAKFILEITTLLIKDY